MTDILKRHYGRRLPISETHPETNPQPQPSMSDLRTRIANAIDDGHITYEQSLEMADAVIRELGLRRADGPLKGTPVHRYITDWIPNEKPFC